MPQPPSSSSAADDPISAEEFRLLIQTVQDYAIFLLDRQGQILTWNAGAARLLGYQADEIIGQSFSCLFTPEDQQAGRPQRELELASTTGQADDENGLVGKQGRYLWVSGVTTAVRDETGTLRHLAKIIHDTTDRKVLQEQQEAFTAIISHELTQPVSAISGYTYLLQERLAGVGDATVRGYLAHIDTHVKRMKALLTDVLDHARLGGPAFTYHDAVFVLETVVREVVEEVQERHPTPQLALDAAGQTLVQADRVRLAQVLENLLVNARKYAPGTEHVLVSVVHDGEGGTVTVRVRDFGPGIAPADQAHTFAPFVRERRAADPLWPSMGLGLYICAQIVQHYGGQMAVQSTPGQGATFSFTLPTARAPST